MQYTRGTPAARKTSSRVALGFKPHTGWTAVVAVEATGAELAIVAKSRVDMATTFDEGAVYHVAEALPVGKARSLIAEREEKFERIARTELGAILATLAAAGRETKVAAVVTGTSKPLPELESVLKSHALIHTAEGELYRGIVARASEAHQLRVVRVPSKELMSRAIAALGSSESEVRAMLAKLGKESGKPWTVDQKESALAALVALFAK